MKTTNMLVASICRNSINGAEFACTFFKNLEIIQFILNYRSILFLFMLSIFISSTEAEENLICDKASEQVAAENMRTLFDRINLILDSGIPISIQPPITVLLIGASSDDFRVYSDIFHQINKRSLLKINVIMDPKAVTVSYPNLFVIYFMDGHISSGITAARAELSDKLCLSIAGLKSSSCDLIAEKTLKEAHFTQFPGEGNLNFGVNVFDESKRRMMRLEIYGRRNNQVSYKFNASNILTMLGIPYLTEYKHSVLTDKNIDTLSDSDLIMLSIISLTENNGHPLSSDVISKSIQRYEKACGW